MNRKLSPCEVSDREITDADLPGADEAQKAHAKKFCRKMHYLLVQMTTDRAQLVVRSNLRSNGLEHTDCCVELSTFLVHQEIWDC